MEKNLKMLKSFTLKEAQQKISEIFTNSKIKNKPQAIRDILEEIYQQHEKELLKKDAIASLLN